MSGIDPVTHRPRTDLNPLANLHPLVSSALELHKLQLLQSFIQLMGLQTALNPLPMNSAFMQTNNLYGGNVDVNSFMTTPASSVPSPVAASPEIWTGDDQHQVQAIEAAVNLSASSSPNILDDLELGWKDILE